MGNRTNISWTDSTFNPWVGCKKITPGCALCYMFTDQKRYGNDPSIVRRTKTWDNPRKWNWQAEEDGLRRRVFTCSWSDFFIEEADAWREEACHLMAECSMLDFQILTKRPERFGVNFSAADNFWLGVSVENCRQGVPRIALLRETPAAVRFLSLEPLIEDLGELDLRGIDWIIIGGESGRGARPMRMEWAESLIAQGKSAGCAVFFKQTGTQLARELRLRDAKGSKAAEWPGHLQVQQFPGGESIAAPGPPEGQISLPAA